MKQHKGLETTLERVGRILSRKYNITVRCKANECKTDGRTIWLPALPDNISDSLWTLIRGELDHETAHILYSDFNGRMKDFRRQWGNFGFDLLNVIEDVRVNHLMQKEYPGCKENILHSIEEIIKKHPIDQMPLPARFLCGLFLAGSDILYDQYGRDAMNLIEPFTQEASRFISLRSTDEACEMAESILQRLKQQAESEKQQSGSPQSSNNSTQPQNQRKVSSQSLSVKESPSGNEDQEESTDTQSRESQDSQPPPQMSRSSESSENENHPQPQQKSLGSDKESNDPSNDSDGQQNDSNAKNQSFSNEEQDGQGGSVSTNGTNTDKSDNEESGDLVQAMSGKYSSYGHPFELQQSIQDHVQDELVNGSSQLYRVYDPSLDKVIVPNDLDRGETYQALYDRVRPHIGTLRQQLIRTLRAKEARFWVSEQEEGEVNANRLYALVNQGSSKVFRQVKECESDSVAVTLLIDLSGSMSGARIELARQVTILFAETLNLLRIPSEIIGFTTIHSRRVTDAIQKETGMDLQEVAKLYARYFPCIYSIFKAFSEPFRALKPKIPAMHALEYTPIDDAILFTAKRIILRNETRKMILILTDGEPYNGNSIMQTAVIRHLREVLNKCEKAGIECIAIGIQTEYVRLHFKEHLVVEDLHSLPKAFYAKFSELLRKSRR